MKILITGIAGTLGRAFYKYLKKDYRVFGIDNNEWAVAEMADKNVFLGDYAQHKGKYNLVIHCAAYKHIDLCEKNLDACYRNNVNNLVWAWQNIIAFRWLFISSDKAVEPISHYGKTKQTGEQFFKEKFQFIARLGNIKHSSGSCIPIWEKAIKEGKSLPVTDPDMMRYFIDVDDAVDKIWKLYQKARPASVIIPKMGKPLKLKTFIKREFGEQDIKIIGKRPGEKIREKLKWDKEKIIYKDKYGEVVR